jgi:3-deoxy-7-phosphoheptulonate synthase
VGVLQKHGLAPRVMVDCSHANSGKNHEKQPVAVADICAQIEGGSGEVFGIMLESFLLDGRQDHEPGCTLEFGKSITDACMSWERTEPLFPQLASAVRARRLKR